MRLRQRMLISYLTAFALLLTALIYWHYAVSSRALTEKILESDMETIRQAALSLDQYTNDVEKYMFNLGINGNLQDILEDKDNQTGYQGIVDSNEISETILTADVFASKTAGVYIYGLDQPYYPQYTKSSVNLMGGQRVDKGVFSSKSVEGQGWFKEAVDNHSGIAWRAPEWDEVRAKQEFCVTRAVLNRKNLREVLGVIRVFVAAEDIYAMLQDISLGENSRVYLWCEGGLLDCANDAEREALESAIDTGSGEDNDTGSLSVEGNNGYLICRDISNSGWKLAGVVYEKDINSQLYSIRNTAFAILLLGIMLTAAMTAIIAGSITKPIEEIAYTMRHYEEQRNTRFSADRKDEVGDLYLSYNQMMDEISRLMQELEESAEQRRAAELNALQTQINPHLLYNTLDCINSLAYQKKDDDIIRLNHALSDFFRISLNRGEETLTLSRELEHVRNYCILQEFRAPGRFSLSVRVDEHLLDTEVIKIILQPLVENAIIHGFRGLKDMGTISITADMQGHTMHIFVTDDGKGADAEFLNGVLSGEYKLQAKGQLGSGYGIRNVHNRLQLAYGRNSGLYYHEPDSGIGITAEIRIVMGDTENE